MPRRGIALGADQLAILTATKPLLFRGGVGVGDFGTEFSSANPHPAATNRLRNSFGAKSESPSPKEQGLVRVQHYSHAVNHRDHWQ